MDGRRFGAGILGGLLLGLFIVGSTGLATFTFGTFGTFSAASNPHAPAGVAETSTSATTTNANLSSLQAVVSRATSTSSTSTVTSAPAAGFAFNPVAAKSPSRLDSLFAQPILLNALVLVPVLIALLLGVLLYRASAGRRTQED